MQTLVAFWSIYPVIHHMIQICFDMHFITICTRVRFGSKGYIAHNSNLCYVILDMIGVLKYADILWNRTLVLLEDKLSSTTVDFIRSEGKLKTKCLY